MKKKILLFSLILTACLVVTACGSKKEEKDTPKVGGWETVLTNEQILLEEDEIAVFEKANKAYTEFELTPVALLAKQVVAGTNYMFLAEANESYKVVVIYKDLEGTATVTKVSDFDLTKYVNKDIENNATTLVGGWNVEAPGKLNVLSDDKVEAAWEKATETLTGMSFNPITVVGKQIVSGTNYAIIAYGRASYDGMPGAIYLLTLYVDLEGNQEISSIAYVDITEFN